MPDTSDTSATPVTRMQHECDTSDTSATWVRHECDTSATRVRHKYDTSAKRTTRVWHEWKIFILITALVKTYFHTPIFTIWQVKVYKDRNNFIIGTTFWKCLNSMRLKSAPQKLNFLKAKNLYQNLVHQIIAANV